MTLFIILVLAAFVTLRWRAVFVVHADNPVLIRRITTVLYSSFRSVN